MQPLPHTPLESSVGCLGTGGGGRRQDLLQKIQFGVWVDGRLLHEGARASGGFDDSSTTDAGNTLPRFIMTMGSICELLPSHMAADPIGCREKRRRRRFHLEALNHLFAAGTKTSVARFKVEGPEASRRNRFA